MTKKKLHGKNKLKKKEGRNIQIEKKERKKERKKLITLKIKKK